MNFCEAGQLIVFGPAGANNGPVHGVAEVAGPATLAVPSEEAAIVKRWLDRDLHPQFDKSMADAICCDYVQIAQVYDLRELRLMWPSWRLSSK